MFISSPNRIYVPLLCGKTHFLPAHHPKIHLYTKRLTFKLLLKSQIKKNVMPCLRIRLQFINLGLYHECFIEQVLCSSIYLFINLFYLFK